MPSLDEFRCVVGRCGREPILSTVTIIAPVSLTGKSNQNGFRKDRTLAYPSFHLSPLRRHEEQQVESITGRLQDLFISDGVDSDDDGSTEVRGSNLPTYITVIRARDTHSVCEATSRVILSLPEEPVFQG